MKIFIGTAEIAGMLTFLSEAFQQAGHEVKTCTDNYGTGYYKYNYDIVLNKKIFKSISNNKFIGKIQRTANSAYEKYLRRKTFNKEKDLHDLYVFIWNGFFPDSIDDYAYLKRKGKDIVSIFCGSDVRHVSAFAQEYSLDISTWEKWFHTTDLNNQIFRLRKAELFSNVIYSVKDQAGLAIRPYNKMYIPFDVTKYNFNIPGRDVPKIVHIPSRAGIKGTSFIIEALDAFKLEGLLFNFELITDVPNETVLQKLADADILIDEAYLHGPGTLSLEGMASGCAVATKTIEGEVYDDVLCNINLENLRVKLRKLITDKVYRIELAKNSRALVESVNNPRRIAEQILKTVEQLKKGESKMDYTPLFYSDSYVLPPDEHVNQQNRVLTKQIIKEYNPGHLNIERMAKEKLI
jgi:glycosyltransferase involved in cell wall biosynthesis